MMDYNPFSSDVQENPYPYYAHLRHHAPVYHVATLGLWAVTRYDDVVYTLRNPQLFSSAAMLNILFPGDLNYAPDTPFLLSSDPPMHTRLRNLVNRAFTPRRIADLEPHIREVVDQLMARIRPKGEFDLIT